MNPIAKSIAAEIKQQISKRDDGKHNVASSIRVSLGTHIVIEAIAKVLEIEDIKMFKQECGVGNPLAYFI